MFSRTVRRLSLFVARNRRSHDAVNVSDCLLSTPGASGHFVRYYFIIPKHYWGVYVCMTA